MIFFLFLLLESCIWNPVLSGQLTSTKCQPFGFPFRDKCFYFYGQEATYDNATSICGKNGGSLIVADDLDIEEHMKSILQNATVPYWIGITREDIGTWVYASDRSKVKFVNYTLEPGSRDIEYGATVNLAIDLLWNERVPFVPLLYICEYNDELLCQNLNLEIISRKCYEISQDKQTYPSAGTKCRNRGGKLAEPNSTAELNAIKNILYQMMDQPNMSGKDVKTEVSWIKGYLKNKGEVWTFEGLNYETYLLKMIPDHLKNYDHACSINTWAVHACNETFTFICESNKDIPIIVAANDDNDNDNNNVLITPSSAANSILDLNFYHRINIFWLLFIVTGIINVLQQ